MHDDRKLVEDRITRYLSHVLQPALHPERTALTVSAWHVPGEPVPVAEALAVPRGQYRPFAIGETWGGPWSTTWFRSPATVPAAWAGRRVEAVFDLGFDPSRGPGGQAEGLVHDPRRPRAARPAPDEPRRVGQHERRGRRERRVSRRGRRQPRHRERARPQHPLRRPRHRRRGPAVPAGLRRPGGARRRGLAPDPRRGGAGRADARAAAGQPAPARDHAGAGRAPPTPSTRATSPARRAPPAANSSRR